MPDYESPDSSAEPYYIPSEVAPELYGHGDASADMPDPGIYPAQPDEYEHAVTAEVPDVMDAADTMTFTDVAAVALAGEMDNQAGAAFLHHRNQQLHASKGIEAAAKYQRANGWFVPNEPAGKIAAYLDLATNEHYGGDGILGGYQGSIERQVGARAIAVLFFEVIRQNLVRLS